MVGAAPEAPPEENEAALLDDQELHGGPGTKDLGSSWVPLSPLWQAVEVRDRLLVSPDNHWKITLSTHETQMEAVCRDNGQGHPQYYYRYKKCVVEGNPFSHTF